MSEQPLARTFTERPMQLVLNCRRHSFYSQRDWQAMRWWMIRSVTRAGFVCNEPSIDCSGVEGSLVGIWALAFRCSPDDPAAELLRTFRMKAPTIRVPTNFPYNAPTTSTKRAPAPPPKGPGDSPNCKRIST